MLGLNLDSDILHDNEKHIYLSSQKVMTKELQSSYKDLNQSYILVEGNINVLNHESKDSRMASKTASSRVADPGANI